MLFYPILVLCCAMLLPNARTCFPGILIGEGASGDGGGTTILSVHIGKHDVWSGSIPVAVLMLMPLATWILTTATIVVIVLGSKNSQRYQSRRVLL